MNPNYIVLSLVLFRSYFCAYIGQWFCSCTANITILCQPNKKMILIVLDSFLYLSVVEFDVLVEPAILLHCISLHY